MDCVVFSGSRADRGPLTPVAKALNAKFVLLSERKASTRTEVAAAVAGVIDEVTWLFDEGEKPCDFVYDASNSSCHFSTGAGLPLAQEHKLCIESFSYWCQWPTISPAA